MAEEVVEVRDEVIEYRRPIWRSKWVIFALGLTTAGAAMWAYAWWQSVSGVDVGKPPGPPGAASVLEPPAAFRWGASFLAGFTVMYLARRALKAAVLVGGLVVAAAWGLHRIGITQVDAVGVEEQVKHGVEWTGQQAEAARGWLSSWVPSATSAAVGGFVGFRKKG